MVIPGAPKARSGIQIHPRNPLDSGFAHFVRAPE